MGTQASGLPQLPKVENESVTARKKICCGVCCLSCKMLESGGEVPSSSGDDNDDDDESQDPHAKCFLECGINGVFQKALESRVIMDLRS